MVFFTNHVSIEVLITELMIPAGTDSKTAEVSRHCCKG